MQERYRVAVLNESCKGMISNDSTHGDASNDLELVPFPKMWSRLVMTKEIFLQNHDLKYKFMKSSNKRKRWQPRRFLHARTSRNSNRSLIHTSTQIVTSCMCVPRLAQMEERAAVIVDLVTARSLVRSRERGFLAYSSQKYSVS